MGVKSLESGACTGRGLPQVFANSAKSFQTSLRHVAVDLHLSLLTCKIRVLDQMAGPLRALPASQ